jgi:iron complex outermembrane receptor protein
MTNTANSRFPARARFMRKRLLMAGAACIALAPQLGHAQTPPTTVAPPAVTTLPTDTTAEAASGEAIIVTGTRQTGRTKANSPAPVDVISAADLQATGEQNVFDALNKVLPSLDLPPVGFDTAGLTRSARLRGLSPDDTLVLVDGKRRHVTANINADIGPVGGSDPVDLDMIPLSLIDHIEVLRDGAAAQYGSDAIAGVINIILKHADHGGSAYAQEGATYVQDGFTNNLGTSVATSLGPNGYFDFGADYRYHDHTNRDGIFPTEAQTGTQLPTPFQVPNPKSVSQIEGDPRYNLVNLGYNTAFDAGPVTLYSFGTYAYRHSEAFENYRDPNTSGAYPAAFQYYPNGFEPLEAINEDDYSATIGVRGDLVDDWRYDLSSTYGGDIDNLSTLASINPSYQAAFGYSPTHFHAGEFNDTEWTNNLDISKPFDVSFLAAPLNIAFGGEFRRNTYQLQQGDAISFYGGGAQAYPGFTPASANYLQRTNEAGYVDLATYLLPHWQVDVAGRFEHYSDVKNTETGKLTTRYDIIPEFAVRGTISNGFRAPTLPQEGFSAVNVGPTTVSGQFPVASAAAKSLGAEPLKPERSQNYEVGFVAKPIPLMNIAFDLYRIDIRDQIVDSGQFSGQSALDALLLSGLLPPTCSAGGCSVFAQYYTNGVNTRTYGADVTIDYRTVLSEAGKIDWLAAANFDSVSITREEASAGFTPDVLSEIKEDTPKSKIILQATYTLDPWSIMTRVTRYGQVIEVLADGNSGGAPYTANRNRPAWIGDIELGYKITPEIQLTLGADNFTDKYANHTTAGSRYHNAVEYIPSSPYGIDGGIYYARLNFKWGDAPKPMPSPGPAPLVTPPPAPQTAARTYLVFFDWDRADLTARAKQIVAAAAEASTHVQTTQIEVDGYTDLSGTVPYNKKLSIRRAETVEAELVRDGVAKSQIDIHGYGESNPLVPTAKGVREPQNRRVEIILK